MGPEATKVKVIAPPERMISVWIGVHPVLPLHPLPHVDQPRVKPRCPASNCRLRVDRTSHCTRCATLRCTTCSCTRHGCAIRRLSFSQLALHADRWAGVRLACTNEHVP